MLSAITSARLERPASVSTWSRIVVTSLYCTLIVSSIAQQR
jgi:hypothetical protein